MPARRSRADAYAEVGRTIDGRFQVLALLGTGSTGDVYRAATVPGGEPVALKVLDPALARDRRQVERFRREVEVCSRLNHPHTVRVIDFGRFSDGRLFLAMEYLEGETLGGALRRQRPLPYRRACAIARQVAEALSEAHSRGIVHRDLKPENIFLAAIGSATDFVKILDFGIARFVGDGDVQKTLTRTGFVAGTPLYLSPEQGLGKRVDGRSDLYTLGVILFEMVVGVPPFMADTPIALVMKHIHEPAPHPSELVPGLRLPPRLEELLFRLLSKSPRERPPRASVVAMYLEEIESLVGAAGESAVPASFAGGEEAEAQARMAHLHALPMAQSQAFAREPRVTTEEQEFRELSGLLREVVERPEVDDGSEPRRAEAVLVAPFGRRTREDAAKGPTPRVDDDHIPVVVVEDDDGAGRVKDRLLARLGSLTDSPRNGTAMRPSSDDSGELPIARHAALPPDRSARETADRQLVAEEGEKTPPTWVLLVLLVAFGAATVCGWLIWTYF